MKKVLLTLFCYLFIISFTYGQWTNIGGTGNYFLNSGKAGIGTNAPKTTLDVTGTFLTGGVISNIDQTSPSLGNISFLSNSAKMLIGWNRMAGAGETDFISNQGPGGTGGFAFYNYDNGGNEKQIMYLQGNGSVTIGTSYAGGYKFAVRGSVVAESVRVQLMNNWPDYVFEPSYKRLSLSELERFVNTYKHLPEVPSAKVVEQQGIDLGDMNIKLLRKIEELTLYLIEQNKEIQVLKEKLDAL